MRSTKRRQHHQVNRSEAQSNKDKDCELIITNLHLQHTCNANNEDKTRQKWSKECNVPEEVVCGPAIIQVCLHSSAYDTRENISTSKKAGKPSNIAHAPWPLPSSSISAQRFFQFVSDRYSLSNNQYIIRKTHSSFHIRQSYQMLGSVGGARHTFVNYPLFR